MNHAVSSLPNGTSPLLSVLRELEDRSDGYTEGVVAVGSALEIKVAGIRVVARRQAHANDRNKLAAVMELAEIVPWAEIVLLDVEGVAKRIADTAQKLYEQLWKTKLDVR